MYKHGYKFYHKTEKIFESRSHRSNKPFVEKYKSLGERICALFHEQGVTIVPIFL